MIPRTAPGTGPGAASGTAAVPMPSTAPDAGRGSVHAQREGADLALLTGPDAGELLTAVLDAEGVDVDSWAVHQVHHRPGVGVTVGYAVTWRARSSPATGDEYLLATSAPIATTSPAEPSTDADADARSGAAGAQHAANLALPQGVAVVRAGDRTLHVWRHPADPALPALPRACDAAAVAELLTADAVQLDLVAYRPLRRAVVRARTDAGREPTTYLKVVRPHTAEALHRRHELMRDAGIPAARTRLLPNGLIVMDELAGTSLTDALAADGAARLTPATIVDLLDALPSALLDLPRRPAWSENLDRYLTAATAALPDRAARIAALGREIRELVAAGDTGPLVVTHGDLHDGNLLLDGVAQERVVGLLDVDTAGPGYRVDDLACLLGHLSVLPVIAPDVHHRVPATLARWTADFESRVDPVALHARSAAVALSLIAGSHQHFPGTEPDRWLDVVDAWVAGAHRSQRASGFLRDLSSSRPGPLIDGREAEDISTKQSFTTSSTPSTNQEKNS